MSPPTFKKWLERTRRRWNGGTHAGRIHHEHLGRPRRTTGDSRPPKRGWTRTRPPLRSRVRRWRGHALGRRTLAPVSDAKFASTVGRVWTRAPGFSHHRSRPSDPQGPAVVEKLHDVVGQSLVSPRRAGGPSREALHRSESKTPSKKPWTTLEAGSEPWEQKGRQELLRSYKRWDRPRSSPPALRRQALVNAWYGQRHRKFLRLADRLGRSARASRLRFTVAIIDSTTQLVAQATNAVRLVLPGGKNSSVQLHLCRQSLGNGGDRLLGREDQTQSPSCYGIRANEPAVADQLVTCFPLPTSQTRTVPREQIPFSRHLPSNAV